MIFSKKLNDTYKSFTNKKEIKKILVNPLDSDYDVGFINRYFAKNILDINNQIIEINEETYNALLSNAIEYPYEYYLPIKIIWKLTGPTYDISINDKIVFGVYDSNKRSVVAAKKKLKGIEYLLQNYLSLAKIVKYDKTSEKIDLNKKLDF